MYKYTHASPQIHEKVSSFLKEWNSHCRSKGRLSHEYGRQLEWRATGTWGWAVVDEQDPRCNTAVAETQHLCIPSGIPVSQKTWPVGLLTDCFYIYPLVSKDVTNMWLLAIWKKKHSQCNYFLQIQQDSIFQICVCFGLGMFVLVCIPNICLNFFMYLWGCMCIFVHAQFVG